MDNKTHILTQYLSGELSVEEMFLVEEKILSNPEWNKEFNLLQLVLSVADKFEYPETQKTSEAWTDLKNRINENINAAKVIVPKNNFKWLKYAAVMALFLVASVGVYNQFFDNKIEWTTTNSRIIKQLPDGSWAILEANSRLSFDEADFKTNRTVSMNGEVSFRVAKDSEHPFEVFFKEGQLKVVGTRFNVKENDSETQVSLFTGKLSITSGTKLLVLETGQTASLVKGQIAKLNQTTHDPNPEIFSLNFKDASLSDIVKGLENRFDISIRFPEKLKDKHYTVRAEGLELVDVMNVLAELTGTVFQKYPDYLELKF